MTGHSDETIDIAEDLVYRIIDPCRPASSSSSSSSSLEITKPPELVKNSDVSARKCTLVIGKLFLYVARFTFF